MRKGEIACNKQFLFFSQCFLQLYTSIFSVSKCSIMWSWVKQKLYVYPKPCDKLLHLFKPKAFGDFNQNMAWTAKVIFHRVEAGKTLKPFSKLFQLHRGHQCNYPFFHKIFLQSHWQLYHMTIINPLPNDKFLDWSKMKQIADDILKCI